MTNKDFTMTTEQTKDLTLDNEDFTTVLVLEVSAEYAESVGAEAATEEDFVTHDDWEVIKGEDK